ncbi:olfactory receptor 5G29-like [Lithobates pipiens]
MLVIYPLTILWNFLIIIVVFSSQNLQSPMYFLLTQLSKNDILLSTVIAPNMLNVLLNDGGKITFNGCIIQFYFFGFSETYECFLLTVMCYDRYLAICKPLHYSALINNQVCLKLVAMCCLLSLSVVLVDTISLSQLQFCRSNNIDHFFCDLGPLLEISCSDTYIVKLEVLLLSTPIIIIPSCIIIISYAYIIFAILNIQSKDGRKKTFSTCSSHLSVVIIFYGTLFCIYIIPSMGAFVNIKKFLSLAYTVVTPLLNPIIYGLRSQEIKKSLKMFCLS